MTFHGPPVLSLRTLNRTLLERQFLLGRTSRPALEVVEHLVALQGQEPDEPYVGLWTRVAGFRHDDLTALLHDRSLVRGALLRATQHLTAADDFRLLRPLVQPKLDRLPKQGFGAEIAGLDLAEVAAAGRDLLADRVLTRPRLGRLLAERFPGRDPRPLGWAAHFLVPMVHPPPSGVWGHRGAVPCALAESWLGRPLVGSPAAETMILRYLAAFGPASVRDVQAWSGITRLRGVMEGMGLAVFHDERGGVLYDVPGAPIADPDRPAPVRFLPAFDNLILGHADRTRVIGDDDRRVVITGSVVRAVFLVDGFVHGIWSLRDSTLLVTPFRPLAAADAAAVRDEAGRLLDFAAPGGRVAFA